MGRLSTLQPRLESRMRLLRLGCVASGDTSGYEGGRGPARRTVRMASP